VVGGEDVLGRLVVDVEGVAAELVAAPDPDRARRGRDQDVGAVVYRVVQVVAGEGGQGAAVGHADAGGGVEDGAAGHRRPAAVAVGADGVAGDRRGVVAERGGAA